jgi:hypothetical protein
MTEIINTAIAIIAMVSGLVLLILFVRADRFAGPSLRSASRVQHLLSEDVRVTGMLGQLAQHVQVHPAQR